MADLMVQQLCHVDNRVAPNRLHFFEASITGKSANTWNLRPSKMLHISSYSHISKTLSEAFVLI